eukprot:14323239-Heterocapsa_arctica.AAC.1
MDGHTQVRAQPGNMGVRCLAPREARIWRDGGRTDRTVASDVEVRVEEADMLPRLLERDSHIPRPQALDTLEQA